MHAGFSAVQADTGNQADECYDAIVIGAGISGMYQLHRLRELGPARAGVRGRRRRRRHLVLEPLSRAPASTPRAGPTATPSPTSCCASGSGASTSRPSRRRCATATSSPTSSTCAATSSSTAGSSAAVYDEAAGEWEIESEDGRRARARFLITAIGPLSAPTMPTIPGVESFRGEAYHTGRWPHEPVSFAGKRVAVIGTGATGGAGDHRDRQDGRATSPCSSARRTGARRCTTARSTRRTQARIKADLSGDLRAAAASRSAASSTRPTRARRLEVSPEEREAFYEKLYARARLRHLDGQFPGRADRPGGQRHRSPSSCAGRSAQRVKDPEVAEKLIPTNHGFGTRRVPLESGYYEVYNQPNVRLVDIRETPIERITPSRHQDQRRRVRVRHDHLRHRLRRHHRQPSTASTSAARAAGG